MNARRRYSGLKPKSWPTASQIPKKVSRRRKRLVVSLSIFCLSLWLRASPRADADCIAKAVPIFAVPRISGLFPVFTAFGDDIFVNRFPLNGKSHHLMADA